MLADLSRRVSEMEGKLCRCQEEDIEVAEVEDDNDLNSELSYETVYHTPVAITGLLEDIPNRLVPIGDLEISRGGFNEEVRDGYEDSDQRLESVTLQVAERILEEEVENDKQVACVSRYWLSHKLTSTFQIRSDEESSNGTDIEHFMHPWVESALVLWKSPDLLTVESSFYPRWLPPRDQSLQFPGQAPSP